MTASEFAEFKIQQNKKIKKINMVNTFIIDDEL
jgi:hypothetical protein